MRNSTYFLGVPIDHGDKDYYTSRIISWAIDKQSRYVIHANAHVFVTAIEEPAFRKVAVEADMLTPDGAPIAWLLRRSGLRSQKRVSGPDLMLDLLKICAYKRMPVYFYGSSETTLKLLTGNLTNLLPDLQIAGSFSPPFKELSDAEIASHASAINESGAKLVFVGLGCPKQELWMNRIRPLCSCVLLGVGAAFDFQAGTVKRAPPFMHSLGLEWLYRLCSEPKRLWRRYLVTNTKFIFYAIKIALSSKTSIQ